MRKTFFLLTLTLVLALAAGTAWADAVVGLTTFTSGTPAIAASVNANFSEIQNSVDDNDTRITSLEDTTPGTASAFFAATSYPAVAATAIGEVTIDVPGPGTVVVTANATLKLEHTNGSISKMLVYIVDAPLTTESSHQAYYSFGTGAASGNYYFAFAKTRIFTVSSAGSKTFYLTATGDGNSYIYRKDLVAIYYPATY